MQLSGRLRGNESSRAVGQEIYRAGSATHVEVAKDFVAVGRDGINLAFRLASDVKSLSVRHRADALRLATDGDDMLDFATRDVDDAGGANVFIGYEESCSICA